MPGKPEINTYQVIARKYRPQTFSNVLGQDPIVATLKNAIRLRRLAHAYLFSGSKGTGKTSLARLLAKAINCNFLSEAIEPCGACASCREIASGQSLDVIEIDGASHRGIEEMRQIHETSNYAPASGPYRVYIIDEVHMLTKEAFNALLKTLEEPPSTVKFIFATTEPHKVLPTIVSRCQRFHLRRINEATIVQKLEFIAKDLSREVSSEALQMIAARSEGALRDAESLLDQLLSFHEGPIDAEIGAKALSVVPQDTLFCLDQAGKEGNLALAFDLAAQIFNEGKDLSFFIQTLTEHYRRLLLFLLEGNDSAFLSPGKAEKYSTFSKLYSKEQLLSILELCLEGEKAIRESISPRIALEGLLLRILRSHSKMPLDQLVNRLIELEKRFQDQKPSSNTAPPPLLTSQAFASPPVKPIELPSHKPIEMPSQAAIPEKAKEKLPITSPRYDTVLQFAAVELEGKIIKK